MCKPFQYNKRTAVQFDLISIYFQFYNWKPQNRKRISTVCLNTELHKYCISQNLRCGGLKKED